MLLFCAIRIFVTIIIITFQVPADVVARRFFEETRDLSAHEARIPEGGVDGHRVARNLAFDNARVAQLNQR